MMAIVASVGPYRFSTVELTAAFCQSAAYLAGKGSPQKRLCRKLGKLPGFNSLIFSRTPTTEGTENHIVS